MVKTRGKEAAKMSNQKQSTRKQAATTKTTPAPPKRTKLSKLALLRPAQVRQIRKLREKGWAQWEIAEKFSVSQSTIHQILAGKVYRLV